MEHEFGIWVLFNIGNPVDCFEKSFQIKQVVGRVLGLEELFLWYSSGFRGSNDKERMADLLDPN